ncbi:interactor protein for cytohesin exchange factors 1-like [Clarias magur]|uniref:Interactor protein for cytohesin exchange factors 1-like n=1 Tax=Clarias magur TaxID=1594786 RepID=A0A8J4T5L8_CLAMG|nr:interactor protein for cytohesin exchange factors 1-like [Clarias magur]
MSQLLQAINQPVSDATELNSECETAPDLMYRTESSPCIVISNSQSEANDKMTRRLQSAEPESFLWSRSICPATVIQTTISNIHTVEIPHPEGGHCTIDEVEQKNEVFELENDYDVPRHCKPLRKIPSEEDIYETPPSNRRASDRDLETLESIYDVPKYVLRKESVNDVSCAIETPEITSLLQNMMTCLEGNSGDWVRVTAPGAFCQP